MKKNSPGETAAHEPNANADGMRYIVRTCRTGDSARFGRDRRLPALPLLEHPFLRANLLRSLRRTSSRPSERGGTPDATAARRRGLGRGVTVE